MQKGLNLLTEKYSIPWGVLNSDGKCVLKNGVNIPLLPFESERRFIEMRGLVVNGRLGNMCTYRIGHNAPAGSDLFNLLYREAGIIEFTVLSKIKEVFAIGGEGVLNCILETENGCVCTLELGATLSSDENSIDKHEIITDSGVALDRGVDTQVPQASVYLKGKSNQTYTDTDAELYGYSEYQCSVIRNALAVLKSDDCARHNVECDAHLSKVVDAAKKSLATLENVKVEA